MSGTDQQNNHPCLLCGGETMACLNDPRVKSVTSDCRPWEDTPLTFVCTRCGHLQKVFSEDADLRNRRVYAGYEIYRISGGREQVIFDQSKVPSSRSEKVFAALKQRVEIPSAGSLLDIGCGPGTLLASFGKLYPQWQLHGSEFNEQYRQQVLSLPHVEDFYSGPLSTIKKQFDLITLFHVFEHVPDPAQVLSQIRSLLTENGRVIIQLPDVIQNPFDMVVIDHYSHFSPQVLAAFAQSRGFKTEILKTDWVPKEITLVMQKGKATPAAWFNALDVKDLVEKHRQNAVWISAIARNGQKGAQQKAVGIFGTAVVGTWLAGVLGEKVSFFVDEDSHRLGKDYLGRPVRHPKDLSSRDCVLLAFPYEIAVSHYNRLSKFSDANYLIPPFTPEDRRPGL